MTRFRPPLCRPWTAGGFALCVTTAGAFLATAPRTAGAAARPAGGTPKPAASAATLQLPIEEHVLSNGMRLVLIPQHITPTVSGAWVAHVGSANERPGMTGISHLFEHMMFKGTHVIGTRDYDKDVQLIEEQERVQDQMRAEMTAVRAARRRGEIDDITSPEAKSARYKQLEARFDSLVTAQRANMVKNEFDLVLQKNGGTMINAFTNNDMTVYISTLPSNKLELWFWMEADRLQNRVFREFYSERDVVYEERRRSYESTPTRQQEGTFDAIFWDSSPYQWPVIGWPSDIAAITKAQADEYYSLYYAPQNVTAFLVGDFDPKQALALGEKYLAAIPAGKRPAPEMITTEIKPQGEKRFYAEAETNPAVTIRWHTVPFVHKDIAALSVLEELLNGPTGRLQKNLVLGAGIANNAAASQDPRKYEGAFEIEAECKEGRTPEEVEKAIYAELDKLQKEPASADEIQKVKNRYLTSSYRQISSNLQLGLRYAVSDGLGSWRDADRIDQEVQAVTAADVQRVTQKYFTKESRAVAIWTRKGGAAAADPALAGLPPEAQGMVKGLLARIESANDPAQVQRILDRLEQMGAQMPPDMKPALDIIRSKAQARLEKLSSPK
jgi:predicted Zn-dependent peptidase